MKRPETDMSIFHPRLKRTFAGRPTDRVRAADHVVSASQGDRTVLLDTRRGRYYGMDGVGTRIWQIIGEGVSFTEVVDRLEREYDAPRPVLEQDAASFLVRLTTSRLAVRA